MLNPVPQLDIRALAQRATALKGEISALANERAAHSIRALQGDKKAQSTIETIDAQRQKKAAELETIKSAIGQLNVEARKQNSAAGRRRTGFLRDIERHRTNFINSVTAEYRARAAQIDRLVATNRNPIELNKALSVELDGSDMGEVASLADVPRRWAAWIVGLDEAERNLKHQAKKHQDDPGDRDIARAHAEARELVEVLRQCAGELLAVEVPMPKELTAALARAERRGT